MPKKKSTKKEAPATAMTQFSTRLSEDTHRALKIACLKRGITVQAQLARLIERFLAHGES